jgi:hypothetical protein
MKAALALFLRAAIACSPLVVGSPSSMAQQPPALSVKPVVEKKLKELPPGPLFWRIETFPALSEAQAAAGPTALAAEISGKVWLFTLGPKGGATAGAVRVAEVGAVPPVQAPEYLLRINHASGPPGARTPHGIVHADAGAAMNGHGADMPMEVFSAGAVDLDQLVMFVVDATRPFSSPARFE